MQNFRLKYFLFLPAFISLIACSHKEVFFEFHSVKNAHWDREDAAVFEVNIENNANRYDISLEVRNDDDYSFRNIWLFVDLKTPEGSVRTDTINADLADIFGKWYGKGLSLHTLSIPYEAGIRFPNPGIYTYTIRQGMRENPLKGISDIGLKVSKKTD
ncbi:gliding motility lipoprotein GldH [Bacteroidia bacterium]|nr:gliding motility lipoprotein GldH [Bacteroidia bacterium]